MTGPGKSVIIADLLARIGHRFRFRLIVDCVSVRVLARLLNIRALFLTAACEVKPTKPGVVLPTEGNEPTLTCVNWILSPARLPIPPRRLVRRQLVIRLPRNARRNQYRSQELQSRQVNPECEEEHVIE